jgi:hypothetical protein
MTQVFAQELHLFGILFAVVLLIACITVIVLMRDRSTRPH